MATKHSYAGTVRAADFPPGDWINVERPLTLAGLRGKVVLLDFWTYGCINCMHIIPDLKRLEAKYPDELVVVGVHSAKFRNEGETENVRHIVRRYEIEHPVLNDPRFAMWRAYAVRAWPTLVLIDPAGYVTGKFSGEGIFEPFDQVIGGLVEEFDARGQLDRTALALKPEAEPAPLLSFPGKVLADGTGGRLFIADSNHHRIVVADLETFEVKAVIGGPESGFTDGSCIAARFSRPQGIALSSDGSLLYVADTENHSIRVVDLGACSVSTIAGNGRQATMYPPQGGIAWQAELNSPWDLQLVDGRLYIAMAGSHQLWMLDLSSGTIMPWAGSGREGIDDGGLAGASLAQPSGLTTDGSGRLYFADSEASAIRAADLDARGRVVTLVGTGLFDFGDHDGAADEVRLQHPLGVAFRREDGLVYIADTYNSKIKVLRPSTREVTTLAGGGHGFRDGSEDQFYEPGGLDVDGGWLYVADTNNHAIRRVELASGAVSTLHLTDPEGVLEGAEFGGDMVRVAPQRVQAGSATLRLDVQLPPGYALDPLGTFSVRWADVGPVEFAGGRHSRRVVAPTLPLELPLTIRSGSSTAVADLVVYYCSEEIGGLCRSRQARFVVPLEADGQGDRVLELTYRFRGRADDEIWSRAPAKRGG